MSTVATFLSRLHRPDDRVALVVIARPSGRVRQRLVRLQELLSRRSRAWLAHLNAEGRCDLYISVNPLRPGARGRTKADVAAPRHVFLDVDHDGDAVQVRLLTHASLPPPLVIIDSSTVRFQAIWRVRDVSVEEVEAIQRGLVREFGGDPAATDVTRVCRLPGYLNWKYSPPAPVTATWGPMVEADCGAFPRAGAVGGATCMPVPCRRDGPLSQSERDWRAVRLALARGVVPEVLIEALARSRPDKRNRYVYATRTVLRAMSLAAGTPVRKSTCRHRRPDDGHTA